MRRVESLVFVVGVLLAVTGRAEEPAQQTPQETIATIDTYGLDKVSRETVLAAAGIAVGDVVPKFKEIDAMVRKLQAVAGVAEADISVVYVPRQGAPAGRMAPTVYIGIREAGRPRVSFRAAPDSDIVLPDEVVETYREFELSFVESLRSGDFGEDDSNGYALIGNEAAREVQRRFVPLAERHFDRLIEVLRTARSADQRDAAAWVLGYAADKSKAADALDSAVRDPNPKVRNNAMRTLGVILVYAQKHPELAIEAPIDAYLDLVESVEWTDRNKAMLVLNGLSGGGNPAVLAKLRDRSLPALIEMARWQNEGHATMAMLLVGRIAGLSDTEISEAWAAGKREEVIARAQASAAASAKQSEPK